LSFPVGIAFELGLFRQVKCRICEAEAKENHQTCAAQFIWRREYCGDCGHPFDALDPIVSDGGELVQAADIYAGLHRQVWGKLPDDIEKDLARRHPAGLDALLENGPIRNPPRTASQFRQWVAENPLPSDDLDPAEYLERRLKLADRYAAAREALLSAGLTALHIVEHMVIDAIDPYSCAPAPCARRATGRTRTRSSAVSKRWRTILVWSIRGANARQGECGDVAGRRLGRVGHSVRWPVG
jgi:hypothetical protein